LQGIKVLEHGDRIAVTACGSVLASLGAEVFYVEHPCPAGVRIPSVHRAGKQFIASHAAAVNDAIVRADIVILSSDTLPAKLRPRPPQIICDITAYGTSGPLAGVAHSDALVQAMCALADTTGEADGPPTICGFPQVEGIAALYAAAGVLAAQLVRTRTGVGDRVEVAMFDCAFSTLSTFLPFHFVGKPVTRAGNRHVLASPWNIYRAVDGWLLICTGSDEQWRRLCGLIEARALASDPRLANASQRIDHRDLVDHAVQRWVGKQRMADAAALLEASGVAAGPVLSVDDLAQEPNIVHRGLYCVHGFRSAIQYFNHACRVSSGAANVQGTVRWPTRAVSRAPLAGLRVLEVGQYTTAPLVARNLGALGADVLKVEPPGGDACRAWTPSQDGQGYFFALSNSDKRSLSLDLRDAADRRAFRALLGDADVLVENLKPGSLDRLGMGPAERAAINPRLIYCAISGFGADSAYPGRPAFDTVIQAMSGIMSSTRANGVPQKTGISYADILGGTFALVATIGALIGRERSGDGEAIDLSMQDAAAWITQWRSTSSHNGTGPVIQCADGYVAVDDTRQVGSFEPLITVTRDAAIAYLAERGISAAPVNTISEVARHPQAAARELLRPVIDSSNRVWLVFRCPIRLARYEHSHPSAIGALGELNLTMFST
jgi:crotonobetainyl-CoA:carnitine CoA-transferase CaiB-like acyl-CoA transferase